VIVPERADPVVRRHAPSGASLAGTEALWSGLITLALESALDAQMTEHLGHENRVVRATRASLLE
jgi:hypothetical protein